MPVLDPSGFMMTVRMRTDSGHLFTLWERGGVSKGQSMFLSNPFMEDIPIVQSVSVELNLGLNGKVSIDIGAPYDMGLELLNSQLFMIGNVIEVQIGYPRISLFLPWFSTMQVRPSIRLDPAEGLTATLEGQGGTFAAARGSNPDQFTNTTYAEIIATIANRVHNNWSVSLPERRRASADPDPLYVERTSVSQGNRSEWQFINYLARQAGCELTVGPDPNANGSNRVTVFRRADGLTSVPAVTLVARGQIDMINRFPLLSFESAAEGTWLPRQRVRTADVDPNTRREPEVTVDQEDREQEVERVGGGTSVSEGQGEVGGTTVAALPSGGDGQFLTAPVTDQSRTPTESANMETDDAAFRGGINATITTIGLPHIYPGQTIRIEGMGVFNGNYMILGMTHQANDSEWTTTMTLITNASFDGESVSTLIQQEWDSFNNQQPEQQNDTEGGGTEAVTPETGGAET